MVEMINKLYIFWWPWGRVRHLRYPQIWALTPKCSFQTTIIHIGPSEPFGGRRGWVRFLRSGYPQLSALTPYVCRELLSHISEVLNLFELFPFFRIIPKTQFELISPLPPPFCFFSTLSWTKILPLLVLLASFRRNKNLEV